MPPEERIAMLGFLGQMAGNDPAKPKTNACGGKITKMKTGKRK